MCGYDIFFGCNKTAKTIKNVLSKFSDNMARRGPDESSQLQAIVGKDIFMLRHFRLSIIGDVDGEQPIKNDDHILLYNGEIFNFKDLGRKHFDKLFKSDTEFLFQVLISQKFNVIRDFDGFFSFTLLDRHTGEIICCRDRFGIKPLLKVSLDSGVYLTTDIKLAYNVANTNTNEIQTNTLKEFLIFGNPLYNNKYLNNISEMEPGKVTRFINNKTTNILDFSDTLEFDKQKYLQSIRSWRFPNEQVKFSLSGGIDSTTIHSILSKKADNSLFLNYESGDANFESDLNFARKQDENIIEICKTEIDLNCDIHKIMDSYFEPYSGGVPSFWVYEKVRKIGNKVCYTGVGGDELFGGYGIEPVSYKVILKSLLKGKLRQVVLLSEASIRSYFNIIELSNSEKIKLLHSYKSRANIKLDIVLQALLKNQFLNACDRFGMYHSVEVRPPLLNVNAPSILYSNDPQKSILRSLSEQEILANDNKVGFTLKASDMVATDFVQDHRAEAISLVQDLLKIEFKNPSDILLLRFASFYHFYEKFT